jgi:hypothetical protein
MTKKLKFTSTKFVVFWTIFHFRCQQENDRGSFDQNSLDRNCVFSVDQKFHNKLIKFFETFQLIKKLDQVPKNNLRISIGSFLALDQKFKITQNYINKTFDQLKRSSEIRSTDKKKFWSNAKFNRNFWSTENVKWNLIKWSFPKKMNTIMKFFHIFWWPKPFVLFCSLYLIPEIKNKRLSP